MQNRNAWVCHTHLLSKGKITFQSSFMLMTIQPFFFASSKSVWVKVPRVSQSNFHVA
jgi:hypothetical protein